VISQLVWAKFDCFAVEFEGFLKVSGLVEDGTLGFGGLGFLLELDGLLLLFWKGSFFSFFSLLLVFGFLGLCCGSGFLSEVVLLRSLSLLVFVHLEQINASKLLEDIHKSWIGLEELHHHLWVLLAHGPFALELWILKVFGNSWVGLKFGLTFWSEHAA